MTISPPKAIGYTWYWAEDYARMRELFKDGHKLPPTFQLWLKVAQEALHMLESEGYTVVKAHIDSNTFPAWCAARSLDMDGRARLEYGNWYADQGYGQTH